MGGTAIRHSTRCAGRRGRATAGTTRAVPDVVCSSSQLAPPIGLYAASLVSLTDVLIGWRASDCDAPTHIVTYPNKHGEYPPSPTWRASPTWRKQKAFPLPVEKAGNSLLFSEAADSPMLADMGRETVYAWWQYHPLQRRPYRGQFLYYSMLVATLPCYNQYQVP